MIVDVERTNDENLEVAAKRLAEKLKEYCTMKISFLISFSTKCKQYYCTFYMLYPFLPSVLLFIDASDELLHVLVR